MAYLTGLVRFDAKKVESNLIKKISNFSFPTSSDSFYNSWHNERAAFSISFEKHHHHRIDIDSTTSDKFLIITWARLDNKKDLMDTLNLNSYTEKDC